MDRYNSKQYNFDSGVLFSKQPLASSHMMILNDASCSDTQADLVACE